MLTPYGVGFYSYMCAWCLAIPLKRRRSLSPRFFIVYFQERIWTNLISTFNYDKMKTSKLLLVLFGLAGVLLASCSSGRLAVSHVGYQSVRTTFRQPTEIPDDAEILVVYDISQHGEIVPVVMNRTSEIMILDQTMSLIQTENQPLTTTQLSERQHQPISLQERQVLLSIWVQ